MFFWLKKVVSYGLMPLSVLLAAFVLGLWLTRGGRRSRPGRALMLMSAGLLLLLSHNGVSLWLSRSLESRYAPIPELIAGSALPPALARCRYVVVLGGGHGDLDGLSATNKLSANALGRLVEGVRLLNALPEARLIVSGPRSGPHVTHASVLAQAAVSLGITPDRILKIENARDTEDESQAVRALAGSAPVALVTSAWHLPRAVALFKKAGVDVLPCPADYLAKPSPEWRWEDFIWEAKSLDRSSLVIRERIGFLWVWLRGKT